ncbi:hypothetical protein PMAYCL1PPCAC_19949, partial [Pristionchus mayeri]
DGIGSMEERILFMTTNYKERLDAALIRPGRIDHRELLDYADEQMLGELFSRFYKLDDMRLREKFVAECRTVMVSKPITMAVAR